MVKTLEEQLAIPRLVYQTRHGEPDGNCFIACIASLLGVGIDEVPDPRTEGCYDYQKNYFALREWLLETHSRYLGWLNQDEQSFRGRLPSPVFGPYVLSVLTDTGLAHAVIAVGEEIVHNPHRGWPCSWDGIQGVLGAEILVPVMKTDKPWKLDEWNPG